MFRFIGLISSIVLITIISSTSGFPNKKEAVYNSYGDLTTDYKNTNPDKHPEFTSGYFSNEKDYFSSAELTSLAHSSTLQAKVAVQNQHGAANQAAFGAKHGLAQAAQHAANTVQAALVGKQLIVQNIRNQLQKVDKQLQAEIALYQQTEMAAHTAEESSQRAQQHVKSLTAALNLAQGSAAEAAKASSEATSVATGQHAMIIDVKRKMHNLNEKLENAIAEASETEGLAKKAAGAAQIAKSNADAAAALAEQSGSEEYNYEDSGKGIYSY